MYEHGHEYGVGHIPARAADLGPQQARTAVEVALADRTSERVGPDASDAPDLPDLFARVAVLIPCYNEALTIGNVVRAFTRALPGARIFVYDNNSTDDTAKVARAAGALVRTERMQGKGHVVRRMFRDIEADWYLLVDGDDTYDPAAAPFMLATALAGPYDLVNGARIEAARDNQYRPGHRLGNQVLTNLVQRLFGNRVVDMLSGYKVLSHRFVKSFPVLSAGFEIETELTVHALELGMPVAHVETIYRGRPAGSASKLNTFRDGWRILGMIVSLFKQERPLLFFSLIGTLLALVSIVLGVPLVIEFLHTHTVPRFPTAIAATGIMMIAFLAFTCGQILDTVSRGRLEAKLLRYLALPCVDQVSVAERWLAAQEAAGLVVTSADAGATRGKAGRSRRASGLRRALAALIVLLVVAGAVVAALSATGVVHLVALPW